MVDFQFYFYPISDFISCVCHLIHMDKKTKEVNLVFKELDLSNVFFNITKI